MADAQANIGINIDASQALAQLKALQRQISLFNAEIARGGQQAATAASQMQQKLISSINATGQFSASMVRTRTTTESFTNALEKNKFSMGQYFRYAGGATKKFGHLFSKEMGVIDKVARERVKDLQTQYIKLGRDANGAMRSIAVRPLALDMQNVATQTAMAAQKQQIFNQLLKQGSTNLLNWGKNTQWAGRQLMVGFTIPLAIFGSAAASSFMKLEEQAIKFKRVYGDLFTTPQQADQAFADMTRLGQEFTKYGVAVEDTLAVAATAAQMGNMGAELTAQVTEATRLAVLGGMEQQAALDTTISLTNAFGVAAEDLTEKINFLNAAENQTILSIEDFNEAVPKAGSVVAQLGGDVEDLAFFLTAMREGGVNASQGANALKSSLGRLINPTQRAKDALAGYGIDVVGIVEENQGNLRETVLQLGSALEQLDPLEKARAIEILFGKFQFARMSALFQNIMSEGSQAATILGLINSESGELAQLASRELGRVEESAATKFRSAIEQFQVALAPIGEAFIKLVTPIIEFGTKVLNLFNNLGDGAKGFIVGIVGVIGGIGPVLLMTIGLIANGIANLMKLFAFFRERMLGLKKGSSDLATATQYLTQEQIEAATVAASLGQEHADLRQIFTSEKVAVDNLRAAYERMTATQRAALGISAVSGATAAGAAGKVEGFKKGRKVPGYQEGIVMVPGPKGAGDIQPAMLAPGEAVIPAKMAEKYAPLINAMITGNIPGYIKGKKTKDKPTIEVGSESFEVSTGEITAKGIQEAALGVANGIDNGAEIVREALARLGNDTRVSVTSFRQELEVVSVEQFGNEPGVARRASGAGAVYKAQDAGERRSLANQIVEERPETGEEEYRRAQAAHEGGQKALREYLASQKDAAGEALYTAEQIEEILRKSNGVVRAHAENVGQLGKQFKEGWSSDLFIAQSEYENQLSNEMEINPRESEKRQKEKGRNQAAYFQAMDMLVAEEAIDIDAANRIKEKVKKNLALNEEELQIQKTILQRILENSDLNSQVSDTWKKNAVATIGAAEARAEMGPASPGVGTRDELELERGRKTLRTAQTRTESGEYVSSVQAKAKDTKLLSKQGVKIIMDAVVDGAIEAIQESAQSSSPSQRARQEGDNLVDGTVQGLAEGKDDMQQAGQQLADAAESGVTSGTKTSMGRGRTKTAGPVTPGQPTVLSIASGQAVVNAQTQLAVSTRFSAEAIGNFAGKVVGAANKIGGIGIAASSLIGGLSMIEGPLGEFANKLFPAISAITALTFALNFLTAEKVAEGVTDRLNAAKEAVADQKAITSEKLETIANQRSTVATNAFTQAITRAGVAATAQAGLTFAKVPGGAAIQGGAAATGEAAKKGSMILSRAFAAIGRTFRRLGTIIGGVVRTIGGFLGALLGISATAVGVIAGLALLGVGIYGFYKIVEAQKEKIAGLGDAANISADKLNNLSDALGIEGSGARQASIESARASLSTTDEGYAGGTFESQQTISDVKNQFLELLEDNDEVKKEWKATISALRSSSQASAQSAMEMLAISLQTEGYSEEQIAGIISALLQEAERTDVRIDFANLEIGIQEGAIEAAFAEVEESIKETTGNQQVNADFKFNEAAIDQAGATLASALVNINAQFNSGLIDLQQYEAQLDMIRLKFEQLAGSGAQGAAQANAQVAAMVQELEAMGLVGLEEKTAGLLDLETGSGATAAYTVAQAEAAGVRVSEPEMTALEAGAREGASAAEMINYEIVKDQIEAATEAQVALNKEIEKKDKLREQVKDFPDQIAEETDAIESQIQAYQDAYDAAKDNENIKNASAVADRIASDEIARAKLEEAQAEEAGGDVGAVNEYLESLDRQIESEKELQGLRDFAAIKDRVAAQQTENKVTEALGTALGDTALAQGIMNDAQMQSALMSKLAAEGFDAAALSAAGLAEALEDEEVKEWLAIFKEAYELESGTPRGGSSGGGSAREEEPTSFLDDIVKKARDFGNAGQQITKGWEDSLAAIEAMADGTAWSFNGLSSQLRRVRVPQTLIEKFLGMEPEEWEKAKEKLFVVDETGEITDTTDVGKKVIEAESQATIAEEIDSVENQIVETENQITAFEKLVAAGADVSLAYDMIQNKALATAIATAKTTAEVERLVEVNKELRDLQEELEEIDEEEQRKQRISEAVEDMNRKFNEQVKALNKIRNAADKYTDAQIKAIFENQDLMSLFLEPEINPGALKKALDNAEKQAKLELDIKLLTFEGREDLVGDTFSKVQDKFDAEQTRIELEFELETAGQEDIIKQAEEEIDSLNYILDDYEAGLQEIQNQEDIINEAYEKRFEALDRIAQVNERISAQQQNQLDLAEALSRGDIAAAARAAQQMREQEAQDSIDAQREMLEQRQEAELASIRSTGGMTREQLEDQVKLLENRIFEIEEKRLEPAQEYIRLAEIRRDREIDSLEVLGRTTTEWDSLQNAIDVARTRNWQFMNEIRDSFAMYPEILAKYLEGEPLPAPPKLPKPPPAPSAPERVTNYKWTRWKGWTVADKRSEYRQVQNRKAARAGKPLPYDIETEGLASGGLVARMAMGGSVRKALSGPPQQLDAGGRVRGPGTAKSDSIPAMLSNGEYVINADSVRAVGVSFLDKINNKSSNFIQELIAGLPAFRAGGFVNTSTLAGILKASRPKPKPKPTYNPGALYAKKASKPKPKPAAKPKPKTAAKPKPKPQPKPKPAPSVNTSTLAGVQAASKPKPKKASKPKPKTTSNPSQGGISAMKAPSKPTPAPSPTPGALTAMMGGAPSSTQPSTQSVNTSTLAGVMDASKTPQEKIRSALNDPNLAAVTSRILADLSGGRAGSPDMVERRINSIMNFIDRESADLIVSAAKVEVSAQKSIEQAKNQEPPGFRESFSPLGQGLNFINLERTAQNLGQWVGNLPPVRWLGEAMTSESVGGSLLRGLMGAISVPGEWMGATARNYVTSVNETQSVLGNPNSSFSSKMDVLLRNAMNSFPGVALVQGIQNAFAGVINPENMRDSMFTQAANYVADNKMFGAVDAEGQARARVIGNLFNVFGDPLTYAAVGLAARGAKATASLGKLSPSPRRSNIQSFIDPIRESIKKEVDLFKAGASFIKNPGNAGKSWNMDDSSIPNLFRQVDFNFEKRSALRVEADRIKTFSEQWNASDVLADAIESYARKTNKNAGDAINDFFSAFSTKGEVLNKSLALQFLPKDLIFADPTKLSTIPVRRNMIFNQMPYVSNRWREIQDALDSNPNFVPRVGGTNPATAYLDSKLLAPLRFLSDLFTGEISTNLRNRRQQRTVNLFARGRTNPMNLRSNTLYQKMLDLFPGNLRAMMLTRTSVHRSSKSHLEEDLIHPISVPVEGGRMYGPGLYLAQTAKFSKEKFGTFGDNLYRIDLNREIRKQIRQSKGYITPQQLGKRGLSIREGMKWDDPVIQKLIEEGYLGYQHGDALTNWLVGADPNWKLKFLGDASNFANGGAVYRPMGGLIPYKMSGGLFPSLGSDTVPAMLTPGEFVIRRPAVRDFGIDNLEKINNGTYNNGSMYNYNLQVNVKSDSNPEQIANTVMREIKRIDSQRIRSNRY